MIKNILSVLCVVAVLVVAGTAQAEMLVNSSFETGIIPENGSHEALDNSAVTGWTTGGSDGIVWYMLASAWGGAAPGGGDMLVNVNGNTTLSQSFAVAAGTEYAVSYYEKKRGGGGYMDTFLGVADGIVSGADGTPVAVSTGPGTSLVQTSAINDDWTLHSFKFTPDTNTTATLTFGNVYGDRGGDNDGVFVDNVSVTAVPEPSTIALLIAGLLGLVCVGRKRK